MGRRPRPRIQSLTPASYSNSESSHVQHFYMILYSTGLDVNYNTYVEEDKVLIKKTSKTSDILL